MSQHSEEVRGTRILGAYAWLFLHDRKVRAYHFGQRLGQTFWAAFGAAFGQEFRAVVWGSDLGQQ